MTTETLILLYFIACLTLGAGCVTLFCLWWAEGREVEDLRKSKEALRESMSNTNRYLQQQLEQVKKEKHAQRKKLTAEINALRTQLHQLRTEKQKQDNQTHKAMTQEQKERLRAWCDNLLVTYRLDFFRGSALRGVVEALVCKSRLNYPLAWAYCREAKSIGFEPDTKDYTELLRELRQIAKEVPLSDTAQGAITYVFGGEWEEAREAIFKLKCERFGHN